MTNQRTVSTGFGNLTLTFENISMGAWDEWDNQATALGHPKEKVLTD